MDVPYRLISMEDHRFNLCNIKTLNLIPSVLANQRAAERGCDAFVTADVKYDQFLDAKELGLTLVDAGHFPTEDVVCGVVARYLAEQFPELTIRKSSSHREVIEYDV